MSIKRTTSSDSEESLDPIRTFPTFSVPQNEKLLKVSVSFMQVIRTTVEVFQPQTYFISSRGVHQSLRQPADGYFRIGRQQITETGQRPNDLMLPPSDRAISRSHCMINYKPFFNAIPPDVWVAFLMGYHPRLGKKSVLQILPIDLFRYILSFLKEQRYPLLIDLGSMCGTYVKVSNTAPIELETGLSFLVGSDINIEIDRIINHPVPLSLNPELTIDDYAYSGELDINLQEGPHVIIKVSKIFNDSDTTMQSSTWKFSSEEKFKVFTIGRSQICDINLPENTISRTQCRVIYSEGKWLLADGIENKATVNGTWLSIRKRGHFSREKSDPFTLKKGTQIKISDTILQVDWD